MYGFHILCLYNKCFTTLDIWNDCLFLPLESFVIIVPCSQGDECAASMSLLNTLLGLMTASALAGSGL